MQRLFDAPPPVTEWVPEVLSVAAHLAIIDENELSDEAVLDWTYKTNRHLAQSRLYRAVASLASPEMALRAARLGWNMLHRGIDLAIQRGDNGAQVKVMHPDSIWTHLVHQATATGFRAVLESSTRQERDSRRDRVRARRRNLRLRLELAPGSRGPARYST